MRSTVATLVGRLTLASFLAIGAVSSAAWAKPQDTAVVVAQATTPAPAAAPAAAGQAPAAKPAEAAENPYGIAALWRGSDFVARFVLLMLVIMSVGSWYILVVKLLEQRRMQRHAQAVAGGFWSASSVSAGAAALDEGSAYRFIADAGVSAVKQHQGLKAHIPVAEWVPMNVQAAVDRVQATTQRGLAFLATVGSTSPFVGLFGTVWGIYHALTAIGISGQASIDKVAGPVGEALIMTAIGLAVAIPAVLSYNWLARRNKIVMDNVREFGDELNAVLVGSAGKAA